MLLSAVPLLLIYLFYHQRYFLQFKLLGKQSKFTEGKHRQWTCFIYFQMFFCVWIHLINVYWSLSVLVLVIIELLHLIKSKKTKKKQSPTHIKKERNKNISHRHTCLLNIGPVIMSTRLRLRCFCRSSAALWALPPAGFLQSIYGVKTLCSCVWTRLKVFQLQSVPVSYSTLKMVPINI